MCEEAKKLPLVLREREQIYETSRILSYYDNERDIRLTVEKRDPVAEVKESERTTVIQAQRECSRRKSRELVNRRDPFRTTMTFTEEGLDQVENMEVRASYLYGRTTITATSEGIDQTEILEVHDLVGRTLITRTQEGIDQSEVAL